MNDNYRDEGALMADRLTVVWGGVLVLGLAFVACSDDSDSAASGNDVGMSADTGSVEDTSTDAAPVADTESEDSSALEDVPEDGDTTPMFMGWPEAAPLLVADRRPLIEGTVGEQGPLLFVYDTLSQTIFADIDVVGDDLFHQEEVSVGAQELGQVVVKGRDMTPDETQIGRDIGGLLGQQFFNQRFTVVDYVLGRSYILDVAPGVDDVPPDHENVPRYTSLYKLPNLFPVIDVQVEGADPIVLLADTSSRFNVITQTTFDALEESETLPRLEGFRFISNFGEEAGFLTRIPALQVGDVTVENMEVAVIPDDNHLRPVLEPNRVFVEGFLGAPFWARFVVGIGGFEVEPGDTEGGTKEFVLWGDGKEPEAWSNLWNKVAVELIAQDGAHTIEMVYETDLATQSGLMINDVVEAIDGVDVTTLEDSRMRLRGNPGETRALQIRRGDEMMEVSVEIEELLP